jgi:prepilin-type processing-associated H-X9-DG protein
VVINPSETIWIGETGNATTGDYEFHLDVKDSASTLPKADYNISPPELYGTATNEGLIAAHLDTTNVLFFDGHVKAAKPESLATTHDVGGKQIMYQFTVEDD